MSKSGMQDVRNAIRALRAAPSFTIVAVVVLMLGIGASTTVFSAVDAIVIHGVPFEAPERLVTVSETTPSGPSQGVAPEEFVTWRSLDVFSGLAALANTTALRSAEGADGIETVAVSADLFSVLRVRPILGQAFSRDSEVKEHSAVGVIGYDLWHRRFGADPNIIGRTLIFAQRSVTVVGVMPPHFTYPIQDAHPIEMWIPYVPEKATMGRNWSVRVVGRLGNGVSLEQANKVIGQTRETFASELPRYYEGRRITVISLGDALLGRVHLLMLILLVAVGLVLAVACLNVAHLMLARATSRSKEMGIRAALGASRKQLARGLFVEGLVLSVIATTAGLLLATWGVALAKLYLPAGTPRTAAIAIDLRVLAVGLGASVGTVLVCGGLPAILGSRADLMAVLGNGGRSSTPVRHERWSAALVIGQVALSMTILVATAGLVLSFVRLVNSDLGFDYHHVIAFTGAGPAVKARDDQTADWPENLSGILDGIRAIPGVEGAAAVAGYVPLLGGSLQVYTTVPGRPGVRDGVRGLIEVKLVTPDYFKVMGVRLQRGRSLTESDRDGAPLVVLLNDVATDRFFPDQDPLLAKMTIGSMGERRVVGVVGGNSLNGPEGEIRSEAYLPLTQTKLTASALVVRTSDRIETTTVRVQELLRSAVPGRPTPTGRALDQAFASLTAEPRFATTTMGLFGTLAIAIAAIGIYGLIDDSVRQRTREIGIRIALGARPPRVVGHVVGQTGLHVTAGLAVGMLAAWPLTRASRALLFQLSANDLRAYAVAGAIFLVVGLAAAIIPACRAIAVEPVVALREE